MLIHTGKYKDKTTEFVTLKDPEYVLWMRSKELSGSLALVYYDIQQHIKKFDSKPFIESCYSLNCPGTVTKASIPYSNYIKGYNIDSIFFWCKECEPYSQGAPSGTLRIFSTYWEGIQMVDASFGKRTGDYAKIIKRLAEAKGLKRYTSKQLADFFN